MNLTLLKRARAKRKTVGGKSFTVAVPTVWNKLPLTLRQAMEVDGFKSVLKAHVFKKAYSD